MMLRYEYPFNERVRIMLRLEALFNRLSYFAALDGMHEHHAALLTLFEIADISSRSDLKVELLQEVERQRHSLRELEGSPDLSAAVLSKTLDEVTSAYGELLAMQGKLGQHLRDNDWLMAIKSRSAIPGGVCEFDLPAYHHWLHQDGAVRRTDILEWIKPIQPLKNALDLMLKNFRSSAQKTSQRAEKGMFSMSLGVRSNIQMVQVELPEKEVCLPEVSANKYMLNIRFVRPQMQGHRSSNCCEHDIEFDLSLCGF